MIIKISEKQSISGKSIILGLTAIFLVTKVIRTFSGVTDRAGGIWNIIQILFVAMGFIWAIKFFHSYKYISPIVIMFSLCLFICFLAVPNIELSISGVFNYLMIPYAACVLITFYVIGLNRELSQRSILYYSFYAITAIVIWSMVRFYSGGPRASFIKLIDVADVYFSLGLLPLVLIYVEKKQRIIPMILLTVALVLTGKRAGILALIVMAIIMYLGSENKDNIKGSIQKILILIAIGVLLYFVAGYLDEYFNLGFFERLNRMNEDGGSGRIDRWEIVINSLKDSSVSSLLIGHGWGSVIELLEGHAHNDFLEILYEFGLFAEVLYISFYISLFKYLKLMSKYKYRYITHYFASLVCSLFLSFFSFYYIKPTYITCGMICYGFFFSDFEKWKHNVEETKNVDIQ